MDRNEAHKRALHELHEATNEQKNDIARKRIATAQVYATLALSLPVGAVNQTGEGKDGL